MPFQLRQLFAHIYIFNIPANPSQLYHQFEDGIIKDFTRINTREAAIQRTLYDIELTLRVHGLCYRDLHLPVPAAAAFHEVTAENNNVEVDIERRIASFTEAQHQIYEHIIAAINDDERRSRFLFLDDRGGTRMTYLYNTLIASLRRQNKCVLTYATTSIVADLLIDGTTVHSGFKLPIPLHNSSTSHIRIPSGSSEKLKQAHLLIIDEASMLTCNALRAIDLLLRQIMNSSTPLGGKVPLHGRRFRQTAPVIPRGSNAAVIESSSNLLSDIS
ncbi:uncharacterized protein LOC106875023 [Octopus bimaculoides]|uniref:uncharacterized protein LOC106875023 n=1 Tax=Octopus bimaculoides TaxID=37653 RepID=UPI00071E5441|nr:uncharacterized protein LOC106875023 [Octopus bimaculoides]|eukprot:XP_014778462.1 PREDICTED: uncharacterized protein LOC106875023 [Octopus bimaculoides]